MLAGIPATLYMVKTLLIRSLLCFDLRKPAESGINSDRRTYLHFLDLALTPILTYLKRLFDLASPGKAIKSVAKAYTFCHE